MSDNSPIILRQKINIGKLILTGKSGKMYIFNDVNPVVVDEEDAPDLLELKREYKNCCTSGEIEIYPYLEIVNME